MCPCRVPRARVFFNRLYGVRLWEKNLKNEHHCIHSFFNTTTLLEEQGNSKEFSVLNFGTKIDP